MSDLTERIAALPPARRQLLDALLQQQPETRRAAASYVAPRTTIEATLAEIWAAVLGHARIGIHDSFFELGGDSIQSIQIIAKARRAGLSFTNTQLFEHPTIAALAAVVRTAAHERPDAPAAAGEIPLTPIQRWFFTLRLRNVHHWNQAVLLRTAWSAGDEPALRAASEHLVIRHEMLRVRFHDEDGAWRQRAGSASDASAPRLFSTIDLTALAPAPQEQSLRLLVDAVQHSLHLTTGPLARIVFIRREGRDHQLLLAAHHLIADAVSFHTLLDEIARDLRGAGQLPGAPFAAWSQHLHALAASPELAAETDYWRAQLAGATPLPCDDADGRNLERDAVVLTLRWDEADTSRLRTGGSFRGAPAESTPATRDATAASAGSSPAPRDAAGPSMAGSAAGASAYECLLAALYLALAAWTGERRVGVWLEGHGRDDDSLDLSRTIGWFTTLFPVSFVSASFVSATPTRPERVLADVRRTLQAVPRKGLGFGLLRYLSPDASARESLAAPGPDVLFNYLGVLDETRAHDAGLTLEQEMAGALYDPDGERPQRLQIYGGIVRNQLVLHWAASAARHRPESIRALADAFRAALREVMDVRHHADTAFIHVDPALSAEDVEAVLARHEPD